jgi:hypothetical protein
VRRPRQPGRNRRSPYSKARAGAGWFAKKIASDRNRLGEPCSRHGHPFRARRHHRCSRATTPRAELNPVQPVRFSRSPPRRHAGVSCLATKSYTLRLQMSTATPTACKVAVEHIALMRAYRGRADAIRRKAATPDRKERVGVRENDHGVRSPRRCPPDSRRRLRPMPMVSRSDPWLPEWGSATGMLTIRKLFPSRCNRSCRQILLNHRFPRPPTNPGTWMVRVLPGRTGPARNPCP